MHKIRSNFWIFVGFLAAAVLFQNAAALPANGSEKEAVLEEGSGTKELLEESGIVETEGSAAKELEGGAAEELEGSGAKETEGSGTKEMEGSGSKEGGETN